MLEVGRPSSAFVLYKVYTKLDFEQLFSSRLDWRPVTEESQLNA